jgi:hypothetical protein
MGGFSDLEQQGHATGGRVRASTMRSRERHQHRQQCGGVWGGRGVGGWRWGWNDGASSECGLREGHGALAWMVAGAATPTVADGILIGTHLVENKRQ